MSSPAEHSVPELSIVSPVCNELENLEPLVRRVHEVFDGKMSFELILVDDGSSDGSDAEMERLASADPCVRTIFFPENHGQTSATAAGIRVARGALTVTIDADLQSDPVDLLPMIEALEDHDAVVGFRLGRKDDFVRRWSSRIANWVRDRLTGDSVRDTGCPLKLFRTEAIRAIPLFEGMHRFLPTLLRYHGYDVIELGVPHHPRTRGKSKYGISNRALKALYDCLAVRWMKKRVIPGRLGQPERVR